MSRVWPVDTLPPGATAHRPQWWAAQDAARAARIARGWRRRATPAELTAEHADRHRIDEAEANR